METYNVPGQYSIADDGKYITVTDTCGMTAGHDGEHKAFVRIDDSIANDVVGMFSMSKIV